METKNKTAEQQEVIDTCPVCGMSLTKRVNPDTKETQYYCPNSHCDYCGRWIKESELKNPSWVQRIKAESVNDLPLFAK